MPLPFLTADRAFDTTDDVALPYDDRDRWRRPYRPGPWRVGAAAVLLLLASFVLFSSVIIAATATPASAATVFGFALVIVAGALRLLRMGVWVSARGAATWPSSAPVRRPGTRSRRCVRCSSRCAGWGCRGPCRGRRW